TPPGREVCRVRVAWDAGAVGWPALVDPAWQTTGSIVFGRARSAQTVLANGQLLVAGGDFNVDPFSAEVYDPPSGTWALTSSMNESRSMTSGVTLLDGRALVIGGFGGGDNKAEIWDPATGAWTLTPNMNDAHIGVPSVR